MAKTRTRPPTHEDLAAVSLTMQEAVDLDELEAALKAAGIKCGRKLRRWNDGLKRGLTGNRPGATTLKGGRPTKLLSDAAFMCCGEWMRSFIVEVDKELRRK